MAQRSDVLIIVPTYNERDNVPDVAEEFLAAIDSAHLLFVDDNSPDGTGQVIDEIITRDSRVHVLHRERKEGLGPAYLAGFQWALDRDYRYVVEMDADFSHDPKYLPSLVAYCEQGAGMAVGSRYIADGGTVNWPIWRQMISRMGSVYARTVLGLKVRDLTSGFVCYRRETLERIDLAAVRSNGYSFQIEMKYRVAEAGLSVIEHPIIFSERREGMSKMSGGIVTEALRVVWRIRLDR